MPGDDDLDVDDSRDDAPLLTENDRHNSRPSLEDDIFFGGDTATGTMLDGIANVPLPHELANYRWPTLFSVLESSACRTLSSKQVL